MPKQTLPNRRPSEILSFTLPNGTPYTSVVCYDRKGDLKEVFLKSGKIGSDHFILMHETSVLLSQLLRFGAKPEEILKSLPRTSESNKPEGPIGILLELLMETQDAS